ncbi:MAG: chromosomal replication initiator protein DnaA [Ruminococcaceae bacterium]|jgi:chromosomal replication initiator protein|nr:chromosomal replication initiator protein DnaA [Oscillospiraceae bacterium]
MDSFMEIWQVVCDYCRERINETAYNLWLSPLKPVRFENDSVTLYINDDFKRGIILDKYLPLLGDAFENTMGFNVKIYITTDENELKEIETSSQTGKSISSKEIINDFASFVVGPSNKFAYAAAKNVAANPGMFYNPLFIWGRSGLGKTHLLNAICLEVEKNFPDANIIYTTSENFTNELVFYLQTQNTQAFRNKYRTCDILLIDDIQFIAGKVQTEEEFFNTFDTLHKNGKQVVLTSDKPPKEIQTLEDRLRTRFENGLLADVQPPDYETRMAIIKNKAKYFNLELSNEIVNYIAEKIKNNVRQLEGAVKKIYALCQMQGIEPSIEVASEAIKDILNNSRPVEATIEMIIDQTGKTFGVTPDNIRSERRDASIVNARQIAMYIMREIADMSLIDIGKVFGGKTHSTVKHSIDEVEKKMASSASFKSNVLDLIKNIQEL